MKNFTSIYSLSKTLRFELKPVRKDAERLSSEAATKRLTKIIKKDEEIKKAYEALKPELDKIHNEIINESLNSEKAKEISFSEYFEEYKKGKNKKLESFEKDLREKIGELFKETVKKYKATVKKKEKSVFDNVLKAKKEIINYLEKKFENDEKLQTHIKEFKRFFGYFEKYNTNRANYYETKEASTAIATRIVHENLPKFCDNAIQFSIGKVHKKKKGDGETETVVCRKDEYLNCYQYLKDKNKDTKIKDAKTNEMVEAEPINEEWFDINKFSECFSQNEIDEYNEIMGHYNLLINLYNQARKEEKDFKKLSQFKTLFKQIGSGKRILFEQIENDEELKETLTKVDKASKKYFTEQNDNTLTTVYTFTNWLRENEDWKGVYWSKAAVDKISNLYLANWHDIKDRIQNVFEGKNKEQKEELKAVATYDKKEEQLKLNDAVELSGLFQVLNEAQNTDEGWSKIFFKEHILEDDKPVIDENLKPSQNLIKIICADIEKLAKDFCEKSENILKVDDYKNEEKILEIKNWLDISKCLLQVVKYFKVRESKIKGNRINPELNNMLYDILHADDADWFGWYDLVRNYLTKKPQDDAKKNKLKLNFENSNLLKGFVDSHTDKSDAATQYGSYLFRKKVVNTENDFEYFLGISKNVRLFRCHLKDEISDTDKSEDKSEFERLQYYQAKPTTYFDSNYSENKQKLIEEIQLQIDNFAEAKNDEQFKEFAKKIKEVKDLTPNKLIDELNKNDNFKFILNEETVVSLISKTIEDLKIGTQNFITTAPKLEKIQNKKYFGGSGLKQIIEDLQKIAKENKVFNFFRVSRKEFNQSINDEKKPLYLFKISNKDLSYSETSQKDKDGKQKRNFKGTENLHTLFFRGLMREFPNCNTIDLGSGEIFFRKAAKNIKKDPTHKVGEKIINRKEKKTSNTIPYEVHNELYLLANEKKTIEELSAEAKPYLDENNNIDESKVTVKDVKHNITKDRRFTEVKYQLHLSIILNFNAQKGKMVRDLVNTNVNTNFTKTDDIQFLGIDRGEKHLVYYSLINKDGKILEQNHFDVINNKDYLKEINEAAKRRREQQQNWQQKEKISNLKDGYISLVIHEIIKKMKDKNGNYKPTFIVLENLNKGFKRGRQKFEQQVYQKFELALAKKLNYLVDKNAEMGKVGSVAKALQLTPPVQNFQDIENRKQLGIMLYTRANYTSVTDPVTGWRKTIYLKKGSEENIKEQIFEKFTEIGFNGQDYWFEYKDKNDKMWKLWSGKNGKSLERYRGKREKSKNEYIIESIGVKELLDELFEKFDKSRSLKQQLEDELQLQKVDERTAWETLRYAIDVIQQIRNSGDTSEDQDDNFLLSPVRDEKGEHFDSRDQKNVNLPKDADANGAYNIARKGIIMYEHIKHSIEEQKQKSKKDDKQDSNKTNSDLNLFISDDEWDLWLNDKKKWKQKLEIFASKDK